MTTLLSQIAAIAAPIVKHYHDDISIHDARVLASFQAGDSAVWLCYDCGSHMARLSWSQNMTVADRMEATRHSLNLFDAVNSVWPNRQWHFLESTGGDGGTVRTVSMLAARALFVDLIRDLERKHAARRLTRPSTAPVRLAPYRPQHAGKPDLGQTKESSMKREMIYRKAGKYERRQLRRARIAAKQSFFAGA